MFTGCAVHGQDGVKAFVGARLIPIAGPEIERGTVVIDGTRIVAVGPVDEVNIPAGAERIDASGKVIMPGLVDTHNHIGGIGAADSSAPIQPDTRVMDSIKIGRASCRERV